MIILALDAHQWLIVSQAYHFAGVKFHEVDGLRRVAVSLSPAFPYLVDHPGIEVKAALFEQVGSREKIARSFFCRNALPAFKRGGGGLYRFVGLLNGGA